MANEAQYINPLIEAMAQGYANKRSQEALKAQTQQYGVENKQKQQALDRLQQQLEHENDFRQKMLDLEHEKQKLETQKAQDAHSLVLHTLFSNGVIDKNTTGDDVGLGPTMGGVGAGVPLGPQNSAGNQPGFNFENMQGGNGAPPAVADVLSNLNKNNVTPQQLQSGGGQLSSAPPPGVPPPPVPVAQPNLHPAEQTLRQTGGQTDGKYIYPTPERAAQIAQMNAAAKSAGEAQGALSYEQQKIQQAHQNQLDTIDKLHQNDLQKDQQHMAQELANNQILDKERGDVRMRIAGVLGYDPEDPSAGAAHRQIEGLVDSVLSGQQDFSKLKPQEQRTLRKAYPDYQWPSNGTKYKAALDAYDQTQELIDKQKRLAVNYSADSPSSPSVPIVGGDPGGVINYLKAHSPLPNDMNNAIEDFNSHSGTLAKNVDSATAGRRPEQEVARVLKGAYDPKRSMKENLQKVSDTEDIANTLLKSGLAGFTPEQKARVAKQRGITLPGSSGSSFRATVTGNIVMFPDSGAHVFKSAEIAQQAADEFNKGGQQ